jgi:hypothetical protein
MFELPLYPTDRCDMVRPAGGIAIPSEQFFKHIPDGCIDPDPMDIQNGIMCDIHVRALHDALAVNLFFLIAGKLDQGGDRGFVQQKRPDIGNDPGAAVWRAFHLSRVSIVSIPDHNINLWSSIADPSRSFVKLFD